MGASSPTSNPAPPKKRTKFGRDHGPDHFGIAHRILNAPAERVYRAFIDPAALSKWLAASGFPEQLITRMRKSGSDSMCMSSGNFPGPPSEIGNAIFLMDWPTSEIGNAIFLVDWPPSEIGNAIFLVDWPPSEIGNAPEVRWNSRDHQRNRSSDSTPPRDGFANGIP
jgi:hypothetical protein